MTPRRLNFDRFGQSYLLQALLLLCFVWSTSAVGFQFGPAFAFTPVGPFCPATGVCGFPVLAWKGKLLPNTTFYGMTRAGHLRINSLASANPEATWSQIDGTLESAATGSLCATPAKDGMPFSCTMASPITMYTQDNGALIKLSLPPTSNVFLAGIAHPTLNVYYWLVDNAVLTVPPNANPFPDPSNILSTSLPTSGCVSLAFRKTTLHVGCRGSLLSIPVNADGSLSNSITSKSIGSGSLMITYTEDTDTLYVGGAGYGLAFEGDALTLKRFTYRPGATSSFIGIFVHKDPSGVSPRNHVVYWMSSSEIMSSAYSNSSTMPIIATGSIPTDFLPSQVLAVGQKVIVVGPVVDQVSIRTISAAKVYASPATNCSSYESCGSCIVDPYCGWCSSSGSCTSYADCTTPGDFSTSSQTCTAPLRLDPPSGSTYGNTVVRYFSTYYRPASQYLCEWSFPQMGAITRTACNVQSDSVDCDSPPAPEGKTEAKLAIRITTNTGSSAPWLAPLTFTYYNCSTIALCETCLVGSPEVYPEAECGWCVTTGICSTSAECGLPTPLRNASLRYLPSTPGAAHTCPTIKRLSPSPISSISLKPIALDVENLPATTSPSGVYECRFTPSGVPRGNTLSSPGTGTVNASNPSSFSALSCPLPSDIVLVFGASSVVDVTIRSASTNNILSTNSAVVSIYSCLDFTSCSACNAPTNLECIWCAESRKCDYKNSTTETTCPSSPSTLAQCPAITSITPNSAQEYASKDILLTIDGRNLPNDSPLTCHFDPRSSANTISYGTPATFVSSTQVTCRTPTEASFTPDLYDLDIRLSAVALVQPELFNVYRCDSLTSCLGCLSDLTPACSWCSEPSNTQCTSSTVTCSRLLAPLANASCPIIEDLWPEDVIVSGHNHLTIMGSLFALDAVQASHLECVAETIDAPPGAQPSRSDIHLESATEVSCNVSIPVVGPATIRISDKVTSNAFSNLGSLTVRNCSGITNCSQCISFGCLLCYGACSVGCSAPEATQNVCPVVRSVSPSFSDFKSNVTITITGENFLMLTTPTAPAPGQKRSFERAAYSQKKLEDIARYHKLSADLRPFLAPGVVLPSYEKYMKDSGAENFDWAFDSDLLEENGGGEVERTFERRAVEATMDTTEGYACMFGAQKTTAKIVSAQVLTCESPQRSTGGSIPLTITYNGVPYFSAPQPFTLFTCQDTSSDTCSSACLNQAHCGWCATQGRCTSEGLCPVSATPPQLWQPVCNVIKINNDLSTISGGPLVFANMSLPIPGFANRAALQCMFGTVPSAVNRYYPEDPNQDLTAVDCYAPAATSSQGGTVPLALVYGSNRISTVVPFLYVNCPLYTSCTKCSVQAGCGWCRTTNRCTMQTQCPQAGKWLKTKCPISPLALGLGIGLGLFFLILVALLIAYLVYRVIKRKTGLLIRMQEPDYDAIAWGADRNLLYRIPSHKYGALERALRRQDHLLQLALSLTCPATEQDSLAKGLVFVAVYHNFAPEMIKTVIRAEVTACMEENTLFRSNSVASKMYKFYSRIVGIKYLYHCIARVVMELEVLGQKALQAEQRASKEKESGKSSENSVSLLDVTMELDTEADFAENHTIDTETNLIQLQLICQKILTVLTKKALRDIPTPLRQIFIEIDRSVSAKFPGSVDAVYKGLGGLFFLRFVCPAITAPHVYGLLERPPNEATQRQLVLIGKVIQSIANMSPPGKKEAYMEVMGSFIESAIPRIKHFYDDLRTAANVDTHMKVYERDIVVPEDILLNGLAATQTILVAENTKVKEWSKNSFLDETSQQELVTIIDECLAEDATAPKKQKKETGATSQKRRTK